MAEKLLDRNGVAALLGVSPRTAYSLMRQMRRVPVSKTGQSERPRFFVTESEVTRWQRESIQEPASPKQPKSRKRAAPFVPDPNLFEPDGRIKRRRTAK